VYCVNSNVDINSLFELINHCKSKIVLNIVIVQAVTISCDMSVKCLFLKHEFIFVFGGGTSSDSTRVQT